MKIHFFASFLILLIFSKPIFSADRDSTINKIFISIYNENYTEAHTEINANKNTLGSFYSDVLKIDLLWWEFVRLDKNNEKQKEFISFLEKFDSKFENNSELKLRQLIKNSYQLRYDFKRFNIVGAVGTRTTLNKLLNEITAEKPAYPENHMKLLQLYTVLFQYFDNLMNPLFNNARREARSKALKQAELFTHDNDIIVKTFSLYFLGKIYLNIEKNKDYGLHCFTELSKYYTQNTLFKEIVEKNN